MSSAKPRIGIVSWDFSAPKGGMGWSLQWMKQAMESADIAVSVETSTGLLRRAGHLVFSLLLPLKIGSWISKTHPDALLVPVGPGGVFLCKRPWTRVIAIAYHTYVQQARLVPGQWWKRVFVPFERRTLRMATHVLCFCQDTKNILMHEYGISEQCIHLLPHAVDARPLHGVTKQPGLCVCVARFEARKGIDVLLQVWPHVLDAVSHARLIIVGDGILAGRIDRIIASLGPSVRRFSSLTRPELLTLVASADVAVCPAYLEGFGLAAAEAMRLGTCVVASNADGLRSLVTHEHSGLLNTPGDEQSLADAMIRVLTDERLRTSMTAAASKRSEEFSRDHASAMLVGAIREIVASVS